MYLLIEIRKGVKRKKKIPEFLKKLNVAKVEGDVSLVHKDHIVWQIQTLEDHFSFFEKIIQQKSGSYQNKIKDLVFVNLVAKDEDSFFKPSKAKVGEYYGVLKQHSLFETIISSNFQGIFFLSQFDSGKYSIPLKWLIFRSEYEIFNFFWEGLNPREKDNLKLCLENFCICLIHMRVKKIYLYSDDDYRYLFFGTSYWKINKQINNMEKISFLTINLLEENKAEDILKNYESYTAIFKKYMQFREDIIPVFVDGIFLRLPYTLPRRGKELNLLHKELNVQVSDTSKAS